MNSDLDFGLQDSAFIGSIRGPSTSPLPLAARLRLLGTKSSPFAFTFCTSTRGLGTTYAPVEEPTVLLDTVYCVPPLSAPSIPGPEAAGQSGSTSHPQPRVLTSDDSTVAVE